MRQVKTALINASKLCENNQTKRDLRSFVIDLEDLFAEICEYLPGNDDDDEHDDEQRS